MQMPGHAAGFGHQGQVNGHFAREARYWADVYRRDDDVDAVIYQRRLCCVLDMVDRLGLTGDAPLLEIGSGAGYAAVALARRGHRVEAVDPVARMVDATRRHAQRAGVAASLQCREGDINALPFADGAFAVVIAMGVLPWLPSIAGPLGEIRRVLRPGGHAILTVDNRWGLRQFVEPYTNPLLQPVKVALKALLRRPPNGRVLTHSISLNACHAAVAAAGMERRAGVTLGFGAFTFLNRRLLPNAIGLPVHRLLQPLADRNVPILRSLGGQYVLLAQKPA